AQRRETAGSRRCGWLASSRPRGAVRMPQDGAATGRRGSRVGEAEDGPEKKKGRRKPYASPHWSILFGLRGGRIGCLAVASPDGCQDKLVAGLQKGPQVEERLALALED